jgi:dimethylhistidine N-methyltransferase
MNTATLAASDADTTFCDDVAEGLLANPKRVPPKYLYDETGSQLFERITAEPEYYVTRTETGILARRADEIARLMPAGAALVEFGAGSSAKTRILLAAARHVSTYVPVDISGAYLAAEAAVLRRDMPHLRVLPVVADFTQPFALPAKISNGPRVGFFPGSTIGNFEPPEATAVLRNAAALLGPGALLIIGVDLVKDARVLTTAYNDAAGVTAAFNLNLLTRINRELDGGFDLAAFTHRAWYNADLSRIEMHLVSIANQKVRACGRSFEFRRGETIHTENSYKYTIDSFRNRAFGAGWKPVTAFLDDDRYFCVHVLVAGKTATTA